MGKWISAALGRRENHVVVVGDPEITAVQKRGDVAVEEALLAGYVLGLVGGVLPRRVQTCATCGRLFLRNEESNAIQCLVCFAKEDS